MPTVPTSEDLGFDPVGTLPGVQASPNDFGAQIGAAAQRVGQSLGQVSDTASKIALQQQQMANQADLNTKFANLQSAVQKASYGDPTDPNSKGFYSLRGKDALDAYQDTAQSISKLQNSLTMQLAPDVRGAFDQASRRFVDGTLQGWGQHYVQQNATYLNDTSNALIDASHQTAIANYNDPAARMHALADSQQQVIEQGQRAGLSSDSIQSSVVDNRSKLLAGITMRMAQDNPLSAWSFYQQQQPQIGGAYQAQIEKELTPQINVWKSRQDADAIMNGGAGQMASNITAAAQQQGVDPTTALTTAKIESGMGRAVSNQASTAKGVFQLTDDTWTANGGTAANRGDVQAQVQLGVKNLASAQQTATDALGRPAAPWETYVVHQQGVAGGPALLKADPSSNAVDALAPAYGGSLSQARAAIVNNGGSADMTAGQFLGMWQNRFQTVAASTTPAPAAASADGQAAPAPGTPTSTDPRDHVQTWLAQAAALPNFKGDPDPNYEAMVQDRIRQKVGEIEYGQAQADRSIKSTLISAAMGVGGHLAALGAAATGNPGQPATPPTSLEGMFTAAPQSRAAFLAADPETQRSVMEMIRANSTQGPPPSDAATTKYYQLRSQSVSDPQGFLGVNLADPELLQTMPRDYVHHLMNLQAGIDKNSASQAARTETLTHARAVVLPDLLAAGINPRIASQNPAMAQTAADFDGRLDESLQQFQAANKRKPTDAETKAIGQTLLTPGFLKGTGSLWGMLPNDSSQRYFQAETAGKTDQFYPNVPAADRAGIVAAFKAKNGGALPTDAQVQNYFMRDRGRAQAAQPQPVRPGMGGMGAVPVQTLSSATLLPPAAIDTGAGGQMAGGG